MCTHNQCFEQKYKKYQNFSNEIFYFCYEKKSLSAAPVAEQLRALFLNHSIISVTAVSGVGSSPALAT